MKLDQAERELISYVFPKQRGNVLIDNLSVFNAILYVAEQGCKWRSLPSYFSN